MNTCRILQRLGGKRRCCPATQTPKVRVLLLHYVLHLVAGLFILSPAIRVEEHYLSLYLIALVRSCLLTSCIVP